MDVETQDFVVKPKQWQPLASAAASLAGCSQPEHFSLKLLAGALL